VSSGGHGHGHGHGHEHEHGHGLTPFQRALIQAIEQVGSQLGVGAEALAILRRIETQQTQDSEKIGQLLMITQEMQDAANQLAELVNQVGAGVQTLIEQGGTGDGATSDEVIGLLSPIASALQNVLDTINAATGGTPQPQPFSTKRSTRGPIVRR